MLGSIRLGHKPLGLLDDSLRESHSPGNLFLPDFDSREYEDSECSVKPKRARAGCFSTFGTPTQRARRSDHETDNCQSRLDDFLVQEKRGAVREAETAEVARIEEMICVLLAMDPYRGNCTNSKPLRPLNRCRGKQDIVMGGSRSLGWWGSCPRSARTMRAYR